jgi:hypothetical protein
MITSIDKLYYRGGQNRKVKDVRDRHPVMTPSKCAKNERRKQAPSSEVNQIWHFSSLTHKLWPHLNKSYTAMSVDHFHFPTKKIQGEGGTILKYHRTITKASILRSECIKIYWKPLDACILTKWTNINVCLFKLTKHW